MTFGNMASQDFERAVLRAFWRKIVTRLTGENNELLPFDEVRERLPIRGQHHLGLQQVLIEKIVGSMGRYHDFDRAFLPTQTRTKDRWISIDKAHYEQVSLPPVELYKIGEIYFVKDGNHRVSVAREQGQVFVDAFVTEIDIPVWLTPDTKMDDLVIKREYAEFLLETNLISERPDSKIETNIEGQYDRLMEHIAVHRWYLGEQRGAEVSLQEAAVSWYDHVYMSMIEMIREQNLLKNFPGSKEADLYLWIMEYQGYLRQANREGEANANTAKTEAAQQLMFNYPLPAVKKLVNVLNRSKWIDKLILRQERTIFLEETHLLEVRPEAWIEITVPGQYDTLREHIAVHRWYMGEDRNTQVPYSEAVISWFDNVYRPLVEIIHEQNILRTFPGRTETDLYLWVIEHQKYLQEVYGSEVPIKQAAEQLVVVHSQRNGKQGGKPDKRTGE